MNELHQSTHKTCFFDGGKAAPMSNSAGNNAVKIHEMITNYSPAAKRAEYLHSGDGV